MFLYSWWELSSSDELGLGDDKIDFCRHFLLRDEVKWASLAKVTQPGSVKSGFLAMSLQKQHIVNLGFLIHAFKNLESHKKKKKLLKLQRWVIFELFWGEW